MTDRNWDAELKKIDRQLESVSDEAMFPAKTAKGPQAQAQAVGAQQSTSTWGVFLRLSLTVALGVGMVFWPYSARCGLGLAGYLGAVSALVVSGIWSSVWTFRHRAAKAHTLHMQSSKRAPARDSARAATTGRPGHAARVSRDSLTRSSSWLA